MKDNLHLSSQVNMYIISYILYLVSHIPYLISHISYLISYILYLISYITLFQVSCVGVCVSMFLVVTTTTDTKKARREPSSFQGSLTLLATLLYTELVLTLCLVCRPQWPGVTKEWPSVTMVTITIIRLLCDSDLWFYLYIYFRIQIPTCKLLQY